MSTSIIEPKPAAALLGGALSTFGIGLATRYTGYDPSAEEVASIVTLATFALAWLVPSRLWRQSEQEAAAPRPKVDSPDDAIPFGTPTGLDVEV